VYPQLKRVTYICNKCGEGVGPFYDNGTGDDDGGAAGAASGGTGSGVNFKPATCPSCESRGSLNMDAESTIYGNYQRIFLQVSAPRQRSAGHLAACTAGSLGCCRYSNSPHPVLIVVCRSRQEQCRQAVCLAARRS